VNIHIILYIVFLSHIIYLWVLKNQVGVRFSAPIQIGPGTHPASYTMSIGPFPGVKRLGHGIDDPLVSSSEVRERVELYFYSPPWAFVACPRVNFTEEPRCIKFHMCIYIYIYIHICIFEVAGYYLLDQT